MLAVPLSGIFSSPAFLGWFCISSGSCHLRPFPKPLPRLPSLACALLNNPQPFLSAYKGHHMQISVFLYTHMQPSAATLCKCDTCQYVHAYTLIHLWPATPHGPRTLCNILRHCVDGDHSVLDDTHSIDGLQDFELTESRHSPLPLLRRWLPHLSVSGEGLLTLLAHMWHLFVQGVF